MPEEGFRILIDLIHGFPACGLLPALVCVCSLLMLLICSKLAELWYRNFKAYRTQAVWRREGCPVGKACGVGMGLALRTPVGFHFYNYDRILARDFIAVFLLEY